MKLYTYFRSSAAFRVRIALGLKGLAWEPAAVHLPKGEHRDSVYGSINPQALLLVGLLLPRGGFKLGQYLESLFVAGIVSAVPLGLAFAVVYGVASALSSRPRKASE